MELGWDGWMDSSGLVRWIKGLGKRGEKKGSRQLSTAGGSTIQAESGGGGEISD